jgi:hypothetical protein
MCSSDNSLNFYRTTRRHILEDTPLHGHAIAQALSLRLSTVGAGVRAQVMWDLW